MTVTKAKLDKALHEYYEAWLDTFEKREQFSRLFDDFMGAKEALDFASESDILNEGDFLITGEPSLNTVLKEMKEQGWEK